MNETTIINTYQTLVRFSKAGTFVIQTPDFELTKILPSIQSTGQAVPPDGRRQKDSNRSYCHPAGRILARFIFSPAYVKQPFIAMIF